MTGENKVRVLTKIEHGVSVIIFNAEFNISLMTICRLKQAAKDIQAFLIQIDSKNIIKNKQEVIIESHCAGGN